MGSLRERRTVDGFGSLLGKRLGADSLSFDHAGCVVRSGNSVLLSLLS